MKGEENYNESYPTCPYCGYEDEDWWDGFPEKRYWGDYDEYECLDCGKHYYLCREINWSAKPSCELNKEDCEMEDMNIESPYRECNKCGVLK